MPVEASNEAVWSFISLVLLPDVTFWRFRNKKLRNDYERALGYPRNVFRRLWWRAYTLGLVDESAPSAMYEDEAVGILERPSIGGNRRLASTIAAIHLRRFGKAARRTDIMRDALKRLRRLHAFTNFHGLTDDQLISVVEECFNATANIIEPSN